MFFFTSTFFIDQILSHLCESCFRTQNCSSLTPNHCDKRKRIFFFFVINLAKVGYETLRLHVADFENTPSTKKTVEVSSVLKVKCQAELKRGFLSLIILT